MVTFFNFHATSRPLCSCFVYSILQLLQTRRVMAFFSCLYGCLVMFALSKPHLSFMCFEKQEPREQRHQIIHPKKRNIIQNNSNTVYNIKNLTNYRIIQYCVLFIVDCIIIKQQQGKNKKPKSELGLIVVIRVVIHKDAQIMQVSLMFCCCCNINFTFCLVILNTCLLLIRLLLIVGVFSTMFEDSGEFNKVKLAVLNGGFLVQFIYVIVGETVTQGGQKFT